MKPLYLKRVGLWLLLALNRTFQAIERDLFVSSRSLERMLEKEERRERRSKKQRLYRRGKRKVRPQYRQKSYALKGTHAKDSRYSNQKKLRRMYRNC